MNEHEGGEERDVAAMNLDQAKLEAFAAVLPAISAFKRAFGRDLSADFLAEL